MREFSGRPSSLLANYDQSLLVLVLSALAGGELQQRRCTAVPWRTVTVQDLPASLRTFVAAGNLALIDAKLCDDQQDGTRWYAGIARWLLRRKVKRALRALASQGFPTSLVTELPARQTAVETEAGVGAPPSLQVLAEPSADLLAAVFAFGGALAGAPEMHAVLHRFGHAVARAVYVFDALEDHDEDRSRGTFNAVVALAGRIGHEAAVAAACRFVELAVVEAQQHVTQFLPAERREMVASILQQLARRAGQHAGHLLGRPETAATRPAEAGDCDCACDGCGGCDCCDGGHGDCDCGACSGCDCGPWSRSSSRFEKKAKGPDEAAQNRPARQFFGDDD